MCHTEVHLTPARRARIKPFSSSSLDVDPDARLVAHARRLFRQRSDVLFHRRAAPRADHHLALPGRIWSPPRRPHCELSPPWEQVREEAAQARHAGRLSKPRSSFSNRRCIQSGRPFAEYAAVSFAAGRPFLSASTISRAGSSRGFQYDKRATTIATPVDEVLESAPRRVPGFRAPDDRLPALAGAAGALRQRVRAHRRRIRGRGSVARLGFGVVPGVRLAGFRSHQQRDAAAATT